MVCLVQMRSTVQTTILRESKLKRFKEKNVNRIRSSTAMTAGNGPAVITRYEVT